MNENLEKYIGELSPEMQEKARQCKDMQELNTLLAENDVELSDDALKAVAGGCGTPQYCNKCGTEMEYTYVPGTGYSAWYCPKCDH